jgi:hypothetical protein
MGNGPGVTASQARSSGRDDLDMRMHVREASDLMNARAAYGDDLFEGRRNFMGFCVIFPSRPVNGRY